MMMYHKFPTRHSTLKCLFLLPATLLALGAVAHPRSQHEVLPPACPASAVTSLPVSMTETPAVHGMLQKTKDEDPQKQIQLLGELTKHLVFPESAKRQKVSGSVVAKITVDKEGNLKNVTISQSLTPDCDKAVVNAVKKVSKQTLKLFVKNNADTTFALPVRFSYQ